ncbi:hypothetical protein [Nonomuraea pusilla]|uniref:hypothetical protein n=1 Tax=Nonomuraea pusilla TaxID=46177 RepID=UPI0015A60F5F|nr:hypothetical protein [Nonomuraea pusilla]
MEVVTPERALQAPPADATGYWLPDVDFVVAVFPARSGWETPSALFLDIGVAIGKHIPVLLIAEPPRKVDSSLAPLPLARVSLTNQPTLAARIKQFISVISNDFRPVGEDPPRVDHHMLDAISRDLEVLREQQLVSDQSAYLFEEIALRLLRAGGADVEAGNKQDMGYDAAGWVRGTETIFPDPLLFEFKLLREPRVAQQILAELAGKIAKRGASFGVIICFSIDPGPVRWPDSPWPLLIGFEITDLIQLLRGQTLAAVLRNRRNAIVHGGSVL